MKLAVQYKLSLTFSAVMAVLLLLIGLLMYYLSSDYRRQSFFQGMEANARLTAITHENKDLQEILKDITKHHIYKMHEADVEVFQIDQDQKLEAIYRSDNLLLNAEFFQEVRERGSVWTIMDGRSYVGVFFSGEYGERDLLVVTSAVDLEGNIYRKKLGASLAIAFLIAIITIGLASVVFSRKLLGPVVRITKAINNINAFNLNTRLEEESSSGEIAELKNTVNEMLERIEAAFRAQHRFIGNTTHSLRTPLTVIAGEAEIAMSKLSPDHKACYSLEMILQETEKLTHIISTLLELARSNSGSIGNDKKDWKIIRIDELILSVSQVVHKTDRAYKLQVDFGALPPDSAVLHVNGNEYLLGLALSNVIFNGFKYSKNEKVTIKTSLEKNTIIIEVIDIGIGIPENEVEQIFMPYFRATNTKGFEGFGIGLPLAMDIVKMHSGGMEVSSKVGMGTKVRIILPRAKPYQFRQNQVMSEEFPLV